jgi:hypothetical protein
MPLPQNFVLTLNYGTGTVDVQQLGLMAFALKNVS